MCIKLFSLALLCFWGHIYIQCNKRKSFPCHPHDYRRLCRHRRCSRVAHFMLNGMEQCRARSWFENFLIKLHDTKIKIHKV